MRDRRVPLGVRPIPSSVVVQYEDGHGPMASMDDPKTDTPAIFRQEKLLVKNRNLLLMRLR